MPERTMILPAAEVVLEIPFHDVDLMAVAWHGHYAKYLEIARCALLDKIAYNYREMRESGFAWPVIELKVRYARPARLGQRVRVRAQVVEYDLRFKINYLITDDASGERLTKAHTVQVAVDMATQEMLAGSPPVLLRKLGIAS